MLNALVGLRNPMPPLNKTNSFVLACIHFHRKTTASEFHASPYLNSFCRCFFHQKIVELCIQGHYETPIYSITELFLSISNGHACFLVFRRISSFSQFILLHNYLIQM